jgi:hypothetical protein
MEQTTKKELAVSFLSDLSSMHRDRLQEIIRDIVGEQLAEVMYRYAKQVIEANPEKTTENASSMLILGYLIRVHETGDIPPENPPV